MKAAVASEMRKLISTRGAYGLLAGMSFIAVMAVLTTAEQSAARPDLSFHQHLFVFTLAFATRLLVLILGIRAVTDELRYGTVIPSLLAGEGRARMVGAKAIVTGVAGVLFTLLAEVAMVATAVPVLGARGLDVVLAGDDFRTLAGIALAGGLWAALGVGVGALVRSQVFAIAGGMVWLIAGEEMLRNWLGEASRYLPGQAGLELALGPTSEIVVAGGLLLAAYAAFAGAAAALTMRRRDIT